MRKVNVKKCTACIALCVLLGSMLAGCTIGGGEPYVMTVDGTQITPGTTTVQELANAGYDLSDFTGKVLVTDEDGSQHWEYGYVYDLTADAEAMTEALGKPKTDTESKTEWERGDYSLVIEYEDGHVSRIETDYPGVF